MTHYNEVVLYPRVSVVQSTTRHAIHLQFDINTNAVEIREVQSPKCTI
jgi:hypothetical protein